LDVLQVDNSELQCELAAAQLNARRRDLLVDYQRRHDSVATAVISRQRQLIDDNGIDRPTDLQLLDDVFDKQTQQIHNLRNSSSFLPAISTSKVRTTSPQHRCPAALKHSHILSICIYVYRLVFCLCGS